MTDPLAHFLGIYGFDRTKIRSIVAGDKYVGLLMRDGHIGVCSTLHRRIEATDVHFEQPDLGSTAHRIVYNAYLNALLNHRAAFEAREDIFGHIEFRKHDRLVMIGFFRPLVKKFTDAGIPLTIFDHMEEHDILAPREKMDESLSLAHRVVLSSTSIANGTFSDIIGKVSESGEIYLLGPSSILHGDLLRCRGIRKIYGTVFSPFDHRVLKVIAAGQGTRSFQKYGQKVNI